MTNWYKGPNQMTAPTDRELAQAYEQGYRDGRKQLVNLLQDAAHGRIVIRNICEPNEIVTQLEGALKEWAALESCYGDKARIPASARAALAKVAQDQPATKGE